MVLEACCFDGGLKAKTANDFLGEIASSESRLSYFRRLMILLLQRRESFTLICNRRPEKLIYLLSIILCDLEIENLYFSSGESVLNPRFV